MNTAVAERNTETEALVKEIDRFTARLCALKEDFRENIVPKIESGILCELPSPEAGIIKSKVCNVKSAEELENFLSDDMKSTQYAIQMLNTTPSFGDLPKTKERLRTCGSLQLLFTDKEKKEIENWPEK